MALIQCPECGGTVSSFAKACPHCGRPMEAVEEAPKQAPQQASAGPVYEPIDTPAYNPGLRQEPEITVPKYESDDQKVEISLGGTFSKVIMILLSIVAIIMLGIYRSKFNLNLYDLLSNRDFVDSAKVAVGFTMSFAALYFLVQLFKNTSSEARQFWACCCLGLGIFIEVVLLRQLDGKTTSFGVLRNFDYICIAYGCSLLLYSGTMKNLGRLFMMMAGIFWIVRYSYFLHNGNLALYTITSSAYVGVGIVCGLALLCMLVCWLIESSNQDNNSNVRLLAAIQALLILAAIVVFAVSVGKMIHHAGQEFDFEKGYRSSKLLLIFVILAGSGSLLTSFCVKNSVLNTATSIFFATAMFLLLGTYLDNYLINATYIQRDPNAEIEYVYRIRDLYFTAFFFLPIGIMMHYVEELTKGIGNKISIKLN